MAAADGNHQQQTTTTAALAEETPLDRLPRIVFLALRKCHTEPLGHVGTDAARTLNGMGHNYVSHNYTGHS